MTHARCSRRQGDQDDLGLLVLPAIAHTDPAPSALNHARHLLKWHLEPWEIIAQEGEPER
jgi:hypothetical protein